MPAGHRVLAAIAAATLVAALTPCGLSSEEPTYWYEQYLRAIELAEEDRLEDAMQLLAKVIHGNPEPNHLVRVPGNQYVSYFPYLERARIELQMGDYAASRRSLDMSETCGEVLKDEQGRAKLEQLRRKIPRRDEDEDTDRAPGPPQRGASGVDRARLARFAGILRYAGPGCSSAGWSPAGSGGSSARLPDGLGGRSHRDRDV